VNDFVEKCRREWKRLGVPDPVADEMATDLAADLGEAAAEGASPEEVLGTGAHDARSFAAAWASERGVIPAAVPPRKLRAPAAIAVFALVAAVGLVLVAVESSSGSARLAVAPAPARVAFVPLPRLQRGVVVRIPRFRLMLPPRAARVVAVELGRPRRALWWIGLTALLVGVAGTIVSTAAWARR
jgi:hypothetical protein